MTDREPAIRAVTSVGVEPDALDGAVEANHEQVKVAVPLPKRGDRRAAAGTRLVVDHEPALGPVAGRLTFVPPDAHDGPLDGRPKQVEMLAVLAWRPAP